MEPNQNSFYLNENKVTYMPLNIFQAILEFGCGGEHLFSREDIKLREVDRKWNQLIFFKHSEPLPPRVKESLSFNEQM